MQGNHRKSGAFTSLREWAAEEGAKKLIHRKTHHVWYVIGSETALLDVPQEHGQRQDIREGSRSDPSPSIWTGCAYIRAVGLETRDFLQTYEAEAFQILRRLLARGRHFRIGYQFEKDRLWELQLVIVRGFEGGDLINRAELNHLSPNWRCHVSHSS